MQRFLNRFPGKKILLGHNIQTKFIRTTEHCASLRGCFVGWCDVQELVAQRHKELTSESWTTPSPGLQNTLKAMHISGWRSKHQIHGASGEAIKCFAVLCGLLHNVTLQN
jgi:hypothetical protein